MDGITLMKYEDKYEKAWNRFVLEESINGTFLQTRSFLNYYPVGRFEDNSLMFMKGNNIVAVIPANIIEEEGNKKLISHMGSIFGGIILGKQYKKLSEVELILNELDEYLVMNKFSEILLKMTGRVYIESDSELIDYFLFLHNYIPSCEIGYAVDFRNYGSDILSNFNTSRKQGYESSLKNGLHFRQLTLDEEVRDFYCVLSNNMEKFSILPLHTVEELLGFMNNRVKQNVLFYGVYYRGKMVAGSMVFIFGKRVFHTQYLAIDQDFLPLYISEFLCKELIETAKREGYEKISFGTATLEHGKTLNQLCAKFKEGFGTTEYVNRTYIKRL